MRLKLLIFGSLFSSALPALTLGQLQTPTDFQAKAISAISAGKPIHALHLNAMAEWTAGSTHETGNAQLDASVDGSSSVQLSLGQASRTETQTKIGANHTCQWIDGAGKSYEIVGGNCLIAIPWFAPGLFTQASSQLPSLIATIDEGAVVKDTATLHQVRFVLNQDGGHEARTRLLIDLSTVKVCYDPATFLPQSLEYAVHPDNNDLQDIPVRVVFSNYQSSSGIMLPFHIERYFNRTLQLTLDVTSASIE